MSTTTTPREAVQPAQHSEEAIVDAIASGDLHHNVILEILAYHAQQADWPSLWRVADSLKREVSVLFASQDLIWVDIGTRGQVIMSPPIGCKLPLRLWIHTHPWDAYWSATDRRTLAAASRILDEALVLGHDHFIRTRKCQPPLLREVVADSSIDYMRLALTGPLMNWTDEAAVTYASINNPVEVV